jgi:DNA-binding winged helix-turn-helix (wHTH) protein
VLFGFDEFELDAANLELRRAGKLVKADALVVRLLLALARNAGRLLTKDELVEQVWGGRAVADNVITVSMARLRKTLGHSRGDREFVATVYGRGYRFVREVTARSHGNSSPPSAEVASEVGPPFVGRERVLGRLRQALSEARAGRGRVCALMGEPGIGKTRLVETLERELLGTQSYVAWGYCRESGDTPPLWPWLRLLREVMATVWTPELEQRLGPLAAEVRALLGDPSAKAKEPMPIDWDHAGRHRGFEAVLRTFTLAAERSPWVLVLDDFHGADAASIELLSLLLDEIAHTRILVVATLRHAQGRRAPRPETLLPQVLGHRNCERITLERLSAQEVASYVAALVDDARSPTPPSSSSGSASIAWTQTRARCCRPRRSSVAASSCTCSRPSPGASRTP